MKENLTFPKSKPKQAMPNPLLEDLLEKEEELTLYKTRLIDLEQAFYYNLELISERDLELSVLEKQISTENERLLQVIQERDELEDLIKTIDEKNSRKIQQLETKMSIKEDEIKDLQRENATNIKTLKKLLDDVKEEQQRKLQKIITKFETQKKEIIKNYKEEMEEKEKYYLQELDILSEKLEQAYREKEKLIKTEEENKALKNYLKDVEKVFLEKENSYLEEIKHITQTKPKVSKEVQTKLLQQEKKTQFRPDTTTAFAQTLPHEEGYLKRIHFLEEQNEVLKHIVKDLKKNKEVEPQPGCECSVLKLEVENIKKQFQFEINNLKKILEEEHKQRTEEDAVIQSLETSVSCLKEKLLLGLQEKLNNLTGDDLCSYTYNREMQTEIQISLLEQKLDSLKASTEEDRNKIQEKLEQVKSECVEKVEKHLKSSGEVGEDILEKIRWEIHKLESKIESEMKLHKNIEFEESKKVSFVEATPLEYSKKKSILKCQGDHCVIGKRIWEKAEQKGFRKITNDMKVKR